MWLGGWEYRSNSVKRREKTKIEKEGRNSTRIQNPSEKHYLNNWGSKRKTVAEVNRNFI